MLTAAEFDVLCIRELIIREGLVRDVHQYICTVFLGIGSNTETQAHHQSQTDQLFYRILLAAFGIILNRVLS